MTINYQTQQATVPTVFVTKGRQRVKQYGNYTIYLNNGEEFEIELFNPTQSKILAKISLNGKSLGSGIVLRPAERVFLERYFDEARKFLFETYEVDGNNPSVKKAIALNGIVDVEFFDEYKPLQYQNWGGSITYTHNPTWTYYNHTTGAPIAGNPTFTSGNSGEFKIGNSSNSLKSAKSRSAEGIFLCSCNAVNLDANIDNLVDNFAFAAPPAAPLETGRVEKGSASDQSFTYDNTTFNTYYSWKTTWTILPESQRPVVKEDLSVYCTGCGAKRKKSTHKFCPICGSKF